MSIQPRLPTELLEAVIDEASDDPRTLRSLSLTCITLLPRSRVRLFSGLLIRTVQQLERSRDLLDSCPWLPPLVLKVSFCFTIPKYSDKRNIRLLDVVSVHLFIRLPNLRAWTMETEGGFWNRPLSLHHSALRCYRIYGGHIRSLELSRIRFHSKSDFRGLISAFTGLNSLTCYCIEFHSREQQPVITATVPTNIRPLPISTLNISTDVDSWVLEYLLACSASKLKRLGIQLCVNDLPSDSSIEKFEQLLTQLPPLSSLVLGISLLRILTTIHDDQLSTTIPFAMTILEHVNRDRLMNVRVEFNADPLAILGAPLSEATASLEACKQLETALLTFPNAAVLVHDPVDYRRAGRAKFWSPIIRRAFPRLDERGLLTLKFTPSKEDAPDPVGHEFLVACVVISHDSTRAATSSYDRTIIIWDIAEGAVLHEWVAHQGSPVMALALSPDSIRLVSSCRDALAIWDMGDGSPMKAAELKGHTGKVTSFTWSPDSALIASASDDGTVCIWDGHTYEQRGCVPAYPHPHSEVCAAYSLRFSPDSSYIAWITSGRDCWIWRPLMGEQPKRLPLHPDSGDIYTTVFSFDLESYRIATAHGNKNNDPDACVVRIWDAATVTPIAVLAGHSKTLRSVSFSSDGRSLLSVDKDMSMWIWDCGTWSGKQMCGFWDSESRVRYLWWCVRHDGKYVAITDRSEAGLVRLWRTSDGECVATFDQHHSFVNHIQFSPNGQFLVSGDYDGIVHIHCLSRFFTE